MCVWQGSTYVEFVLSRLVRLRERSDRLGRVQVGADVVDGRVGMQVVVRVGRRAGQTAEHRRLEMRRLVETRWLGARQDADHQSAAENAAGTTQSFLSLHSKKET